MIILGTDFSSASGSALATARQLAACVQSELQVVHVRSDSDGGRWAPSVGETAWLQLAKVAQREVIVRRGRVWVELARMARERRARMIVIGTHGRSGFQPIALGSTASRLPLIAPIPVILVGRQRDWPLGRELAVSEPQDHHGESR